MEVKRGIIISSIFRNECDGYTIAALRENNGTLFKVCGVLPAYADGTPLLIKCQGKAGSDLYEIITVEESSAGIDPYAKEKFLVSSGLSPASIRRLMAEDDLFTALETGTFRKHASIGEREIVNQILLPKRQREFYEFIKDLRAAEEIRINIPLLNAYVEQHRGDSVNDFRMRVYEICVKDLGMTFQEAEKIAREVNPELRKADERILSLATYEMAKAEKGGNTCKSLSQLSESIQNTLYALDGHATPREQIHYAIQNNPRFVFRGGLVSTHETYQNEMITSRSIKRLLKGGDAGFKKAEIEESISDIEAASKMKYAPQQKAAFKLLLSSFGVLTGGPGTGKTTVLNGIIKCYVRKYPLNEIVLCSPTGRAAQRMSEATGMNAATIHRLVGIGKSKRGEKINGDLIIVDEASMLDIEMSSWLFSAIRDGGQVILVGDIDQLPSVGPGNVLKDLIQSGIIPVCRLETVYRQSGESPIITNANRINSGDTNLIRDKTFKIVECQNDKEIMDRLIEEVTLTMSRVGTIFDFQVLGTSHKGDAGIAAVNKRLQEIINPHKKGTETLRFGSVEFRIGDKVITTKNNYQNGYFNGDIGEITNISKEGISINILGRKIVVPKSLVSDVSLAYCISIHKSQGSEFDHAIIVLPEKPAIMLKRNLLYTGVTRAKRACTILSGRGAIARCVNTIDNQKRDTALISMLLDDPPSRN